MTHKSVKWWLLLFIFIFGKCQLAYSQEVSKPRNLDLSVEDYMNLTLPPLDVLFENAKNAPGYELMEVQEEIQRKLLTKEKMAILGFFSLRGSWQYGNFVNDASYSDIVTPTINSYNSATQTSYSIGAGLSIPLNDLFDLGSKVKRQRLTLRAAELTKEDKYEFIKKEIIHLYTTINSQLGVLKIRSEAVVLANAQYLIVEKNFNNGTVGSDVIAYEKERQSVTRERFETTKFELNKSLLTLEAMTYTVIIKK